MIDLENETTSPEKTKFNKIIITKQTENENRKENKKVQPKVQN